MEDVRARTCPSVSLVLACTLALTACMPGRVTKETTTVTLRPVGEGKDVWIERHTVQEALHESGGTSVVGVSDLLLCSRADDAPPTCEVVPLPPSSLQPGALTRLYGDAHEGRDAAERGELPSSVPVGGWAGFGRQRRTLERYIGRTVVVTMLGSDEVSGKLLRVSRSGVVMSVSGARTSIRGQSIDAVRLAE